MCRRLSSPSGSRQYVSVQAVSSYVKILMWSARCLGGPEVLHTLHGEIEIVSQRVLALKFASLDVCAIWQT